MAKFYNKVVFKAADVYDMMDKARIAIESKKMKRLSDNAEKDDRKRGGLVDDEKCLIITEISLTKPMKIVFINKNALKVLQYPEGVV